jgi:hypothetical protein
MPSQPQSVAGIAAGLASEQTDRAADLAIVRTQLAADLAIEQAKQNAEAAYDRGRREAQVDARLDGHGEQIREVKAAMTSQTTAMGDLALKFDELNGNFREHIAVEAALASALREASTRGISARAHYVSLGLFLVGVAGLIIGLPGHT